MTIFTDIKKMLTLAQAAAKGGRHVQEDDLSLIKNAALIEDRGRILWVGEKSKLNSAIKNLGLSKKQKAKEIQLKADCVLPAFLECHTHLVFAGDRKHEFEMRNRGATYQEIAAQGGGIRYTVKETQKSSAPELLRLAEARAQQFLQQGVTTLEVKSGYGLTHKDEIKLLEVAKKIKSVDVVGTYLGAHALPQDRAFDEYLEEMIVKTLPLIRKKNLAERVDMFIEQGYYNLEHAKKYFGAAARLGFRLTAHVEQMSHMGSSSVLLQEYSRVVDSLDHLVQVQPKDIERLAEAEAACVLLPTSDFYLKMKYPPARALIDHGACVALATDFNPGTSPTMSVNFVGVLARLEMKMTLPEVLGAYTVGAAHALHRKAHLGSLEAGKRSDFLVIDGDHHDLFYQVGSHPVREVYRHGRRAHSAKN